MLHSQQSTYKTYLQAELHAILQSWRLARSIPERRSPLWKSLWSAVPHFGARVSPPRSAALQSGERGGTLPSLLPCRRDLLPFSPVAAHAGFLHLAERLHPREHPPGASSTRERAVKESGTADTAAAKALQSSAAIAPRSKLPFMVFSPVGRAAPHFSPQWGEPSPQ